MLEFSTFEHPYADKLLLSSNPLILHEKDWEQRLGVNLLIKFIESEGLIRPSLIDIEGHIFHYEINDVLVNSEIIKEDEALLIAPLEPGYPFVSKKIQEVKLYKYSHETGSNLIRQINNLSVVNLEMISNNKISVVGEMKLKSFSCLVLRSFDDMVEVSLLKSFFPEKTFDNYDKIIVLSKLEEKIDSKFTFILYKFFSKIPIEAFKLITKTSCEQLCKHFKYPLLLDTQNQMLYVFGEKLGKKKNTNLYKFVLGLVKSLPSLPMDTEIFFNMHAITTEAYETAIKELRSQLKEKINKARLTQIEKEQALSFFDLISDQKTRGQVDLKLESRDIHFW